MIRAFIAIPLPDDVTDALMDVQDDVRNARWVEEENLHLTLSFLGDCTPSELTALDAELGRIRMTPFDLTVTGVGAFGGGKPHTLYAGIEKSEPLSRLQAKIERLVREAGIAGAGQRRKFHPHVTLARCGGGVIPAQALEWTRHHARFSGPSFPVHGFGIYRSDLGTGAPIYTELVQYPLLAPSAA
jgi:2'-5' RNA ligase